jgi:hypothetical protein
MAKQEKFLEVPYTHLDGVVFIAPGDCDDGSFPPRPQAG